MGCNAHPTQFLMTVNCLSYYKLSKSVIGSNVGEDVISSFLAIKDQTAGSCKQWHLIDLLINNRNLGEAEAALESNIMSSPKHPHNIQKSNARLTILCGWVCCKEVRLEDEVPCLYKSATTSCFQRKDLKCHCVHQILRFWWPAVPVNDSFYVCQRS